MIISSIKNPKIKELADLRESRSRKKLGLFLIEGARELDRALISGYECRTLFFCEKFLNEDSARIIDALSERLKIELSPEVFEKAAVRDSSDGVLAVMVTKDWTLADIKSAGSPFLLALEDIEKPGNLGALARTADGVGADAIIVLDSQLDIYNPNAIRASIGTIFSRPIVSCSKPEFIGYCQKNSILIVGASPHAKQFYHQVDLKSALAITLGSEAWGLTEKWEACRYQELRIPMNGVADSLNVSVAGAILMYETLRQRSF